MKTLLRACTGMLWWLASACTHSPANAYMTTPGDGDRYAQGSMELGQVRLRANVCQGVPEDKPEQGRLDVGELTAFLVREGYRTSVVHARPDLAYVDVEKASGGDPVRLRVAVLDSPQAAGQDLHRAILEHGEGSWGVHRSNLAVLAPIGSLEQDLAFAAQTKLACWGVLTVAGQDDDFVIPGGYMEF